MNYIERHWKGDLSLKTSFFINFLLLDFIYMMGASFVLTYGYKTGWITSIEKFFWNYYFIFLVLSFWQAVGIYRAANLYQRVLGKLAFPWIARTCALFVTGCVLLSIIRFGYLSMTDSPDLFAMYQQIITLLETA